MARKYSKNVYDFTIDKDYIWVTAEFDVEFANAFIEEECHKVFDEKDYDQSQRKHILGRIINAIFAGQFKLLPHIIYMMDGRLDYEVCYENFKGLPVDGSTMREYANGSVCTIVTVCGLFCP
jgi:hypothetical protein